MMEVFKFFFKLLSLTFYDYYFTVVHVMSCRGFGIGIEV